MSGSMGGGPAGTHRAPPSAFQRKQDQRCSASQGCAFLRQPLRASASRPQVGCAPSQTPHLHHGPHAARPDLVKHRLQLGVLAAGRVEGGGGRGQAWHTAHERGGGCKCAAGAACSSRCTFGTSACQRRHKPVQNHSSSSAAPAAPQLRHLGHEVGVLHHRPAGQPRGQPRGEREGAHRGGGQASAGAAERLWRASLVPGWMGGQGSRWAAAPHDGSSLGGGGGGTARRGAAAAAPAPLTSSAPSAPASRGWPWPPPSASSWRPSAVC